MSREIESKIHSNRYIPRDFIDDLLTRVDIVEIIDSRVRLRKSGGNFVARCPFHEEKTPSFTVSQKKQFYYCFGCGATGNVIKFMMRYDHMNFIESIDFLANHLGLEVPKGRVLNDVNSSNKMIFRKRSFDLLTQVNAFYRLNLEKSSIAQNYLKERGLTKETIDLFAIGFALPIFGKLNLYLDNFYQKESRSELIKLLLENGLLKKSDSQAFFERFHNRIIFPIRNVQGKVIAFGGRTLKDDLPKYLNSPETPLFCKGNELYGLFEVKNSKRKIEELIVVEGYMDVIMLVQHGIFNAVATMGTAVTSKQIRLLLRYTNKIVFCFDSDQAGEKAAWRALELVLPLLNDEISVRFLFLPNAEDPDSFIKKNGRGAFLRKLRAAKMLSDFFLNRLSLSIDLDTLEGRAALAKRAQELIDRIPDGVLRELLLEKVAKSVRIDLEKLKRDRGGEFCPNVFVETKGGDASLSLVEKAISLLLIEPALVWEKENIQSIRGLDLPYAGLLVWLHQLLKSDFDLGKRIGSIMENCQSDQERQLLAKLAMRPLLIPQEGLKNEFLGIIDILSSKSNDRTIEFLLNKANSKEGLTLKEKRLLRDLILKNKR